MVGQGQRPLPQDRTIPFGHHLEAQPAGALWKPDESGMYDCRRRRWHGGVRCEQIATIKVNRGGAWWRYCETHAYDRWIENGRVMQWILVRDVQAP